MRVLYAQYLKIMLPLQKNKAFIELVQEKIATFTTPAASS